MTITKIFVQEYVSDDIEARVWDWKDTNKTYEDLKKALNKWNGWFKGARIVEKIFDEETFTIKTKVLKKTTREFTDGNKWEIVEEIY